MPIVTVSGVPHAYELTEPASAPTLVFIHGWLLSRAYWRPIVQRLSPDYQCLTYDLRGFGESQGRPSDRASCTGYSLLAYTKDLMGLLEALQISDAWLVGHSLGGSVALWAADQLPQVSGVVCMNAGGGIYLKEEFERFRSVGQQLVKLRPRWLRYVPLLELLFTRASVVRAIDRSWGRQRLIDYVVAQPEAALGSLLDSTTEEEVHRLPQIVARLKQPVYFIAGAQDPIMEPQYVRHLASFHPLFQDCGANVTEIPECGHLAMLEQPDVVEATLRSVLATHVRAS